jgi:hypothetical protein
MNKQCIVTSHSPAHATEHAGWRPAARDSQNGQLGLD